MAANVACLALIAVHRTDLATRKLLLSEAQLETALRLRAAPYFPQTDIQLLLARYGAQIDAEDELADTADQHREEATERGDLSRLRRLLASGAPSPALNDLTDKIARREQAETTRSRHALAHTERMVALGAAAIGAVLLGCALLFIGMLRFSILRPIRLLLAAAGEVREGGTAPMRRVGLAREFDELAAGFNAMIASISWQRRQLLELNKRLEERVDAQRRALARYSALELDGDTRTLGCNGRTISLTARECGLMDFLLKQPGRVVNRDQVLLRAWGGSDDASDNLVDVYVGYLRRKLRRIEAPWEIVTIRSAGFVLRLKDSQVGPEKTADIGQPPASRRVGWTSKFPTPRIAIM